MEYSVPIIPFDILQMKYMAELTSVISSDISPLALSILALLDARAMHPYEMASTMRDRHYDEFVRLNFGSLYHTVDALERDGWIAPGEREKEGRRPERTIYRLTDSGRKVLRQVIGEIVSQPRREYPQFAAGLMHLHHMGAAAASEHLKQRFDALGTKVQKLTAIMNGLREEGVSRLALIELEHKIAMYEAERAWVRKIEREVSEGKLEWTVGRDPDFERLRKRHGTGTH
jgi:DNA-binding PadR family transcriptional regulator